MPAGYGAKGFKFNCLATKLYACLFLLKAVPPGGKEFKKILVLPGYDEILFACSIRLKAGDGLADRGDGLGDN